MIQVNLVPQDILDKARQKQFTIQGALAAAALSFLLALVSFGQYLSLKNLQAQAAKASIRLKSLQTLVSEVQELEKTESDIRDRLNIINGLLKNRTLYPQFMSDFAQATPWGIQVKNLTTSGGGSAGGSLKVTLDAGALDNEDIARWIGAMQNSGRFTSIVLGAVTTQNSNEGRTLSFTLTATYTPEL